MKRAPNVREVSLVPRSDLRGGRPRTGGRRVTRREDGKEWNVLPRAMSENKNTNTHTRKHTHTDSHTHTHTHTHTHSNSSKVDNFNLKPCWSIYHFDFLYLATVN